MDIGTKQLALIARNPVNNDPGYQVQIPRLMFWRFQMIFENGNLRLIVRLVSYISMTPTSDVR